MRNAFFLFIVGIGIGSRIARAQNANNKDNSITIHPGARNTDISIVPAESENAYDAAPPDAEHPLRDEIRRWSRMAGGFWISAANTAVIKSNFHITSDKVLFNNASEFGFGIGGQLDFGTPALHGEQSFRLRGGFQRLSVTPSQTLLNSHTAAELENSAKILTLMGMLRVAPDVSIDYGTLWYGGGLQINHVFSTSRSGQGGQQASSLKSSYGFNLLVALGLDIPVSDISDVGVEMDWSVFKGFGGLISFRSSL